MSRIGLFPREALGGRTPREMLDSGQWVKASKACYRHESGTEVCRVRGGWMVSGHPNEVWSRLWVAADEVERGRRRG